MLGRCAHECREQWVELLTFERGQILCVLRTDLRELALQAAHAPREIPASPSCRRAPRRRTSTSIATDAMISPVPGRSCAICSSERGGALDCGSSGTLR